MSENVIRTSTNQPEHLETSNEAIKKAKEFGIGWVTAKGSNHFSIAGHWAMMAEEQGLLGMAFTNTSPMVIPTRGAKPTYGTNPIRSQALNISLQLTTK